jgi:hypothetical protein
VLRPLEGVVPNHEALKEKIEDVLEAVIAYGDLQEHSGFDQESSQLRSGRLLYAAPPAFVPRASGAVLIVGITPDRISALPEELEEQVEHSLHARQLGPTESRKLATELRRLGLIEIDQDKWLRCPPKETCEKHIARLTVALNAAPAAADIPGLTLLDPARPVTYYRGRWSEPRKHTGRLVGRRSQPYGADLWCFAELVEGQSRRFIDLPLPGSQARGCDEAWHLQAAIDADRKEPQRFRVRQLSDGATALDFFSPVPMWARRRWDAIGTPIENKGCLFSYSFSRVEVDEEIGFIRERLWLEIQSTEVRR